LLKDRPPGGRTAAARSAVLDQPVPSCTLQPPRDVRFGPTWGGRARDPFSPCGRRWPRGARSDEGLKGLSERPRATPHPALRATLSRKGRGISRGQTRVHPRNIRPKPSPNQRPKKSRPELILGVRAAPILELAPPPGRPSSWRPGGWRGRSSGKRSSVVLSDASGVLGRFPETSGRSPGGEGSARAPGAG